MKEWSTSQKIYHPFVYFPLITAAMLAFAIGDEHGWRFYALLRWCAFGAFLMMILYGMGSNKPLCVIGIIGLILFNPLVKVHLGREAWKRVDAAAIPFLLWSSFSSFKTIGKKDE